MHWKLCVSVVKWKLRILLPIKEKNVRLHVVSDNSETIELFPLDVSDKTDSIPMFNFHFSNNLTYKTGKQDLKKNYLINCQFNKL